MSEAWIKVIKDYSLFIIAGFFAFLFYLYKKNESAKEDKLKKAEAIVSKDLDDLKKDIEKKLDAIMLTVEKTHEFVIRQDEKNKVVMERIEELYNEVSSLWTHYSNLNTKVEGLLVQREYNNNLRSEL